ncbi:MAG TPA: hypothetical protein VLM37_00680 [Fibrobacteraceae bacterium]|nr:hypothetical protein [Fibrobacteraceae bacterium]
MTARNRFFKWAFVGAVCMVAPVMAVEDDVEFDIPAKIDIQGKKVLWNQVEDSVGDNLEEWFGRATVSVEAKGQDFSGLITVRAIPAAYSDTSNLGMTIQDDDTIYTEKKTDKFELYEAWTQYNTAFLNMKLGRYHSNDRYGVAFGNYADETSGARFMPAGRSVDAIELNKSPFEGLSFRVAFESEGSHLNNGGMRAALQLANLQSLEWFHVGINYRNNMFSAINDPDLVVSHNFDFQLELPLNKVRLWGEIGFRDLTSDGNSPGLPITGGIELPGGRLLNRVIIEAEWDKDRENKEVLGSLFLQKKVTDRFLISFGVLSNNDSEDFAMQARLTSIIN